MTTDPNRYTEAAAHILANAEKVRGPRLMHQMRMWLGDELLDVEEGNASPPDISVLAEDLAASFATLLDVDDDEPVPPDLYVLVAEEIEPGTVALGDDNGITALMPTEDYEALQDFTPNATQFRNERQGDRFFCLSFWQ